MLTDGSSPAMTAALAAAVADEVGSLASVERVRGGTQGELWRVHPRRGSPIAVKCSHNRAAHDREVAAYREWRRGLGAFVPSMLAVISEPAPALIFEWVDGVAANSPTLARSEVLALHRQAGVFCRALERLPHEDRDPVRLVDALPARLARWCARGAGHLEAATLESAQAALDARAFEGVARVPAHRDFSPQNWIAVAGSPPRLVVVDFGQARADAPLTDLLKLWDRPWRENAATRHAFLEGYGRSLTEQHEHQLRQLAIVHGVATAVWGAEHGAPEFRRLGEDVLARVLQD